MSRYTIPPDLVRHPESAADVLPLAGEVNWGMAKLDVPLLRNTADGSRVRVGVVDTGADARHPLLKDKILAGRDFTGSVSGWSDPNGHGTHTAATAAGNDPRISVAAGSPLLVAKCLGDQGSGDGTSIARGMRWLAENGAVIISMSIGAPSADENIRLACEELARAGIWIVCAGGNSGPNTPDVDFPARFGSTISAAAIGPDLKRAGFSNRGTKIDTAAPGVGIWSAKSGGGYIMFDGTSMACPFVAGCLACYRSGLLAAGQPIPDVYGVRSLLSFRSVDIGAPGDDIDTGPGWVSPMFLAAALRPDPPPLVV